MRRFILILLILFMACEGEVLPKPKAYLDLSYPNSSYQALTLERPYTFEVSALAIVKNASNNWLKLEYPTLRATLDLTYRPVQNNLVELLQESEKLVFKHTVKADKISSKDFENPRERVYGTLYEITGNAASQLQFHLTDSTDNFLKGALYFKTRPNYDSVLPAVLYLKKDILRLFETLEWTNE